MSKPQWFTGTLTKVIVIFLILSQINIFYIDRTPWFDVSFSLDTVNSLKENGVFSIDWQHYDVHPPMYYYTLYIWQGLNIGQMSEYHWAQELSVVFMLAFLIFAYLAMAKLFGRIGALAVSIYAVSSTLVHYGTEARMYAAVMMLSAFIFYCIVSGWNGWHKKAGTTAIILLPLFHYLAIMCLPMFMFLHRYFNKRNLLEPSLIWPGFVGTAIALFFAIPQKLRTVGTWFFAPSISSFPSALFYTIFMLDDFNNFTSPIANWYYYGFLAIVLFVFYKMFKGFVNDNKEDSAVLVMMSSAIFPLVALIGLVMLRGLLGENPAFNLYHHRFFLVVTWMFTAGLLVGLLNIIDRQFNAPAKEIHWKLLGMIMVVALTFSVGIFNIFYANAAHHELQHLEAAAPCGAVLVEIGHESPFSALPFDVYAREHNCNWDNFVVTGLSQKWKNAAGFDAMKSEDVYDKEHMPQFGFYYVRSYDKIYNLTDRDVSLVKADDGVDLVWIAPADITVQI